MAILRSVPAKQSSSATGLVPCPDCKTPISPKANSCPKCGRAIQATAGRLIWKVIFWFAVIGGAGAVFQRFGDSG